MTCIETSGRSWVAQTRREIARERAQIARAMLASCHLCAHHCGVNRLAGEHGLCHAGADARFFSSQVEVSDELELIPTFAVALSGCDLRCDFCITGRPSWNAREGKPLDAQEMADRARQALDRGARTVMVLGGEPTIHLLAALEFVAELPDSAKLIWKTNAHGSAEARALLDGMFDVWLADFKFGNDECAMRLAKVSDYVRVVKENLLWVAGKSPCDAAVQESVKFESTIGRQAKVNDPPSPLPSPAGRGRIVRALTEKPASGLAGRTAVKQEADNSCSLSQRERVRERFSRNDSRPEPSNRPLTPSLSPSEGERVSEGRVRGSLNAAWFMERGNTIHGRDHNSLEVAPNNLGSTRKHELPFAPPELIVRHLLMPGHIDCCWRPVAEWLAMELPGVKVNLRSGFWPAWHASRHPELRGPVSSEDARLAVEIANDCELNLIP